MANYVYYSVQLFCGLFEIREKYHARPGGSSNKNVCSHATVSSSLSVKKRGDPTFSSEFSSSRIYEVDANRISKSIGGPETLPNR